MDAVNVTVPVPLAGMLVVLLEGIQNTTPAWAESPPFVESLEGLRACVPSKVYMDASTEWARRWPPS